MRADQPLVAFFGDSHTAGVGDSTGLGWVGRVMQASREAGFSLDHHNFGVRGERSVEVLDRWQRQAFQPNEGAAASAAVFAVGANDASDEFALAISDKTSCAALTATLDGAICAGLAVFCVGPAPVGDSSQIDRILHLSARFATLCLSRGVPYAPLAPPLQSSQIWIEQIARCDGAHPDAAGYQLMAEIILTQGWLDWLRTWARSAPG